MSEALLSLTLLDGARSERIGEVTSVVAGDASGQFGVQAGHAEFVTMLEPGIFRYRTRRVPAWTFMAGAGGLLSCTERGTEVRIVSSRFLRGATPEALQAALDALLAREGRLRLSTRASQLRLVLAFHRMLQQLAQAPP